MISSTTFQLIIASGATVFAAFSAYYSYFVSRRPKVYVWNQKLRIFLDTHVRILEDKYYPSPFYWEGRMQTILSIVYRITYPKFMNYERELFTLADGGEIALDFANVDKSPEDGENLRVLFFPGLTSSSQTSYVKTLTKTFNEAGASVVVFNNRGLGGIPFKTPRTYSASNCDDAYEVVAYLKKKYPGERLIAVGTSLGGMVLSSFLIKHPKEAAEALESAIIISIAWDCNGGTANLETSFINKQIINKELTNSLKKLAEKFIKSVDKVPPINMETVRKAKTLREFDSAVTAPQFGFANVDDYYTSATIKGRVHLYPIPVFGLNAEDDPMQPGFLLPKDEAELAESKLALIVTSHGGHLGFLEGSRKKEKHYMERLMGQLVLAIRLYGLSELQL